jgi:putative transposase
MQLTAQILLEAAPEQAQALKQSLRETNACCDFMSRLAFKRKVFSRFGLQKVAYREVREAFPTLADQVIIRAFAKVADAYAISRTPARTFKPLGAIAYDSRILSFKTADKTVSVRAAVTRTWRWCRCAANGSG